jgi:hypothetical protein
VLARWRGRLAARTVDRGAREPHNRYVRTCGETKGGAGFGAHDHICWPFDGLRITYEAGAGLGLWIAGQLCTDFTVDLADGCAVRLSVSA